MFDIVCVWSRLNMSYVLVLNEPEEGYEASNNRTSLPEEDDYSVGNETPDEADDDQSDYAADEGEYYDDRSEVEERTTTSSATPVTTPTTPSTNTQGRL